MAKKLGPQPPLCVELDEAFWAYFAGEFWEQKPLAIRNIESSLLELDEAYIFNLLVVYSDRCRKQKQVQGFKLFVDGQRQYEQEVLQILPQKKDKSFLGYHRRMQTMFDDYCLVCDELLQVSEQKWQQLSEFTKGLYQQVGFPNRFAEMGLYLGNYRKTPFGVHVDGCGVFSFPVVGKKTFRLWTPQFVENNKALIESHHYSRYKKDSQVLVAEPGDMTYWPSSAWHIAESNGDFSATWSLGVWLDRPHVETVAEVLKEIVEQKMPARVATSVTPFRRLHSEEGEVDPLPELYSQTIAFLLSLKLADLEDAFLKSWMTLTSKQGFKVSPKPEAVSDLTISDHIQIRPGRGPILWARQKSKGGGVGEFYAFNGVLIEAKTSPQLLKLIKALNSGEVCSISCFLTAGSCRQELTCLQELALAGALVKRDPNP